MHKKIEAVTVYGNAVRANHTQPCDMGHLWHALANEIDITANTIYAIYYNYETDDRGEFDFALGTTEDNGRPAPRHEILAGEYYVWDVGSQDPMDVRDAWYDIWESDIKRAYTIDFELHAPGENVKIYLAV